MSHLDEQIAEALTHGPDTLTYILAQEVTTARARVAELEARRAVVPEHLLHDLAMAAWDAGADAGIAWDPDAPPEKRGITPLTPEEGLANSRAHFAKHGSGSPNSEFGRALQAIREHSRAIPADRALGEGMVAVSREDIDCLSKAINKIVLDGWARSNAEDASVTALCLAFQPIHLALRVNQGGVAT